MENPLVTKDLLDSIVQLREDVDRELRKSKYYIALQKLDELLAAIQPLGTIEPIVSPDKEADAAPAEDEPAAPAEEIPAAPETVTPDAPAAVQAEGDTKNEDDKAWTGVVKEAVYEQGWKSPATETPAPEQRP
jgi:hypothetical protein